MVNIIVKNKNSKIIIGILTISILTTFALQLYAHNKSKIIIQELENEINELCDHIQTIETYNKELNMTIDTINEHNIVLKSELETGGFKEKVNYNPSDVSELSGVTYEQLKYALRNTKLSKHVDTFLKVEEKYGINALTMVGIVANESAWLGSDRAKRQNNVTGYAVYSDSAKGATFSSVEESILKTAEVISTEYLKETGKHYNGKSTKAINTMYSADPDWYNIVNKIAGDIQDDINNFYMYLYHT